MTGSKEPYRTVLLYGPPGTGKTMLAKALGASKTLFNVQACTLVSKFCKNGQKLVSLIFEMARFYQPSIVLIDEIDIVTSK
jgi:katanin p60 ATPase-containing subunit A1